MQTIPFGGLSINPGAEPEGYDEQKDLIERGVRKIQSVCARDGNGDINVIRAVLTEEKGTLFTVCINGDSMEFGLYSNGTVTQDMVYGHPPIRVQHMDRLCSRVENDLQGRLKWHGRSVWTQNLKRRLPRLAKTPPCSFKRRKSLWQDCLI